MVKDNINKCDCGWFALLALIAVSVLRSHWDESWQHRRCFGGPEEVLRSREAWMPLQHKPGLNPDLFCRCPASSVVF